MRKCILFSFIVLLLIGCGEPEYLVVELPNKNFKTKTWKGYYYNGDKFTGETLFYNTSDIYNTSDNKNEKILIRKRIYKEGLLIQTYDYYDNGEPRRFTTYSKGTLNPDRGKNGEDISYYQNGQIEFKYNYKDDKYEGEQLTYMKSGKLYQKFSFVDGLREGEFYEDNVTSLITGKYNKGLKDGEWIYENQTVRDQFYYREGSKVVEIYENGKLISESKTTLK